MTADRPDVRTAVRAAAADFAAFSDTPMLDAELLMAHALGVDRTALLIDPARYGVPDDFAALVDRRRAQEPIAYIIGNRDFWTIRLMVGPGVLIPRADSETLIAVAVDALRHTPPSRILDLGTGPGTLLLAALDHWRRATGIGIERSTTARDYAQQNAAATGVGVRATIIDGDWTVPGWADDLGRFDLILANPPYVEQQAVLARQVADYEPAAALFAGPDGLDDYRRLMPAIPALLADGGIAIVEIGKDQAAAVSLMAAEFGMAPSVHRDLAGLDRAVLLARH